MYHYTLFLCGPFGGSMPYQSKLSPTDPAAYHEAATAYAAKVGGIAQYSRRHAGLFYFTVTKPSVEPATLLVFST